MTTISLAYRLTLYAPRLVDPTELTVLTPPGGAAHADPFKVTTLSTLTGWKPYLGFPRGRTGRVNVLERTTDIGTMTFDLFDVALVPGINATRWVSAFLGDGNGDPQLGGLRCFVEESLDGGSTWGPFWTGYVKALTLTARGKYALTVRDMMYELTKLPLFRQPPHASVSYARPLLLPIGITGAPYGTQGVVADLSGTVTSPIVIGGSTLANVARVTLAASSVAGKATNFVTSDLIGAVAPNTIPRALDPFNPNSFYTLPNFAGTCRAHLTWNSGASQGDFKVGALQLFADTHGHHALTAFLIQPLDDTTDLGYAALPTNATTVTLRLFQDYRSATVALFIDVANPLTLLADVLAGKLGPLYRSKDALPPGKVYGDARRSFATTVTAATVPDLPPARFRIEQEAPNALEWVQKNLLRPYGLALVVDGAGAFTVIDLRLPQNLGNLAIITDADVVADTAPTWTFDRDAAIYRAEGSLWEDLPLLGRDRADALTDPYPPLAALLLKPIEHPVITLAIGAGNFGEKIWQMGGEGYRVMAGDAAGPGGATREVYLQRRMLEQMNLMRRPYAHGETTTTLPCRRTATVAALVQGQVVQVTVSTLPNPATGGRGGTRICRVTEITRDGLTTQLRLLDLGVAAVAAVPSLGTPALGSDPRHTATITVTLSADGLAEVRYALTPAAASGAPADTDPAWHSYSGSPVRVTGSITLTELTPGLKVWMQARTFPDDRASLKMPSAWVTSTGLVLTAYGVPSAVTITNITAGSARVSWTNGALTLLAEIWLRSPDEGAYTRIATLLPGSNFFTLWGLAPSTTYGVLVQYRNLFGIVSGAAAGSFTTTSGYIIPIMPPPPRRRYL